MVLQGGVGRPHGQKVLLSVNFLFAPRKFDQPIAIVFEKFGEALIRNLALLVAGALEDNSLGRSLLQNFCRAQ